MSRDDAPFVEPRSRADWRRWLVEHHETAPGAWLVTASRAAEAEDTVDYEAAIEEALCFGWVDSTARRLEDGRGALYFARRRRGSTWAATNKARVTRLAAAGLMTPAGQAAVDRARADGSWTVLDPVEALEVPDDLGEALAQDAAAAAGYESLGRSRKKQVLWHVVSAKRSATRARRIRQVVDALAEGGPLPG